jgi:hypothetical protein
MHLPKLPFLAACGFMLLTLSGCATFTSPARVHELQSNKPYWMDYDASRRGAIVIPDGSNVKMCSEPTPDVALNFAEQILVQVQAQTQNNPNIDGKVQAQLSETAMELAGRTQMVLFLRESLYRLCEQSVNGNLNHDEVKQLYELVIQTSLKLAESDVAKNQKQLAEALKDPNVRRIWDQMHQGAGGNAVDGTAPNAPPPSTAQAPKKPATK